MRRKRTRQQIEHALQKAIVRWFPASDVQARLQALRDARRFWPIKERVGCRLCHGAKHYLVDGVPVVCKCELERIRRENL